MFQMFVVCTSLVDTDRQENITWILTSNIC